MCKHKRQRYNQISQYVFQQHLENNNNNNNYE